MWLKGLGEESGEAVGERAYEPEPAACESGAGESQREGDTGDQGNVAEVEGVGLTLHRGEAEEEHSAAVACLSVCACVCVSMRVCNGSLSVRRGD